MNTLLLASLVTSAFATGVTGLALALGGPADPVPMASISDPFKGMDLSDLPAPRSFAARDGTQLVYRAYAPRAGATRGSVVLVHGSSATGVSMHILAKALAADGATAYALDMRGHGGSGTKGRIDYLGQLEDDVEDFMRGVRPEQPATLIGFSSGGGFALRFAGSARQGLFSHYVLLAPFMGAEAPTTRPDSGGWVSVGVPRYVALAALDKVGIRIFSDLPVIRFSLTPEARSFLTPQYSYTLAENFRPLHDYRANIRAAQQPLSIVVGGADEVFRAEQYAALFGDLAVTVVPGVGHIRVTLESRAVDAVVGRVRRARMEADELKKLESR